MSIAEPFNHAFERTRMNKQPRSCVGVRAA